MTGMDTLLASLTPTALAQFNVEDTTAELLRALEELEAEYMRWLMDDLEKRIRE